MPKKPSAKTHASKSNSLETQLAIINNIGQMMTDGLDLNSAVTRVGERLRDALNLKHIGITIPDLNEELLIAQYYYSNRKSFSADHFSFSKYKSSMRLSMRGLGRSWVVNTNAEKSWRKFASTTDENDIPKSFILLPLLAGKDPIGGITIADYEKENAFTDISIDLLETIASNMGTAIQNVRLFDETKRLFKEAEEARATAEHANKAKSTFLANMSHELRTPLNAIMGFTSIVRKKAEGVLPEKQLDNLDKVTSSSEHLLGLINTVLDIAKIEAGRMDIIPAKFNLNILAEQCVNLATPLLKPNVILEKQLDESISIIYSDQDKIKQILLNLLSNAIKFTHTGKVILSLEKIHEENVSISVKDSGIGISEEGLSKVFEEFQQAETTTTRQYGGTGLGLTISRNLAQLLGGDLIATSELGKGSIFKLIIPIQYENKSAFEQIQEPASADPQPDSVSSIESQAESVEEKVNDKHTKTILIVEDTELNINFLTQLLEDDYNLLIAKDGAQGVSMAQQNNPDLILMDISLPIMDGYEATRHIRTTSPSTPIIGLSAYAMTGDAEKAKQAGCNDYLTKPINKEILIKKIKDYLR